MSKLPLILTFVYILLNVGYGLVNPEYLGRELTYSIWWLIHGSFLIYLFLKTANQVFERNLKIALRVIGVYIFIQSIISAIDNFISISETLFSVIVLLYFLTSLAYWKYDRRRIEKS